MSRDAYGSLPPQSLVPLAPPHRATLPTFARAPRRTPPPCSCLTPRLRLPKKSYAPASPELKCHSTAMPQMEPFRRPTAIPFDPSPCRGSSHLAVLLQQNPFTQRLLAREQQSERKLYVGVGRRGSGKPSLDAVWFRRK